MGDIFSLHLVGLVLFKRDLEPLAMNFLYKIILWLKKRLKRPLNGPGAGPVFRPIFRRVSNGVKTPEQIDNGRESVY